MKRKELRRDAELCGDVGCREGSSRAGRTCNELGRPVKNVLDYK